MSGNKIVTEQISYLKSQNLFTEEYLNFYQKILTIQHLAQSHINKEAISLLGKTADIETRLTSGLPLLKKNNIYVDDKFSDFIYQEMFTLFKQYQQQMGAQEVTKLNAGFKNRAFKTQDLLKNFAAENRGYFLELAEKIESGLLIFIARTMSLPFFRAYGEIFKTYLENKDIIWQRPFCPLCGNLPALALLEKEVGKRFLWCAVCDSQWEFIRFQCPFCLNSDHTRLKYFFTDDESPYRVDVCDHCKRYLKTFDERKNNSGHIALLSVHEMATLYLDELAFEEGYDSGLWWKVFDEV